MDKSLIAPSAALVFALSACGGGNDATPEQTASDAPTTPDTAKKAVEAYADNFIPEANQFGVRAFKIVYEMEGQQTGKRTIYVEDYGARVGLEEETVTFNIEEYKLTYWDGAKSHLKTNNGPVSSIGIRPVTTEPSSFATTPAADLKLVGYERMGEKTVAGKTCEVWKNANLNYEGCRWNNIELEFANGAGTDKVLQRVTAVEFIEGQGVPAKLKALAQ